MNDSSHLEEMRNEISAFPRRTDASPVQRKTVAFDVARGTLLGLVAGLIYFAIVSPARHNARRSSCQSNLKQIALAYKQYITDYDEKYPLLYTDQDGSGRFDSMRDQGWVQNIQPYGKNLEIFQCPSESNPQDLTGGLQTGYTDYFVNGRLQSMSESKFTHFANTILMGDHSSSNAACSVSNTKSLDQYAKARHLEGANYSFVDGHVKWLKPDELTDAPVNASNYSFQVN